MKTITKLSLIVVLLCGFSFANAQVPPVAPPDLEYDAEDVLSFFSEKYGEKFPEMASPTWEQTATWDYTATGDDQGVLILRDLGWLPIALGGNAEIKAYDYVHVDVFCNEATLFQIGFHRHYPDTKEQYFPLMEEGAIVAGKWYSIDYPMADFLMEWENNAAHYLRFGGGENEYSDEIYVTNFILFNGEPTCLGGIVRDNESGFLNPMSDYSFDVYVSNNSLKCTAVETIKTINIYNLTGQAVSSIEVNEFAVTVDLSSLVTGTYIISAELKNGAVVSKRFIK